MTGLAHRRENKYANYKEKTNETMCTGALTAKEITKTYFDKRS